MPGGTGTFSSFSSTPVIDGGDVAFEATGADPQFGIYTNIGGSLGPVVITHTLGPHGVGNFSSMFIPSIDAGSVAFRGRVSLADGATASYGVYMETAGSIVAVAENGTPATGGAFLISSNPPHALALHLIRHSLHLPRGPARQALASTSTVMAR